MIEMRIVDRGFYGMEYQYRYKHTESVGAYNDPEGLWIEYKWSEWKTAPVLKEEEIEK